MLSPMMGGVIVASFVGGRMVSRSGRYKRFPVLGLAAATLSFLGLALATRAGWGAPVMEALLVVLGLGIGSALPNLTTAIQNAVRLSELGGATAAAAFFRSLGGALGVALAGTVLAMHLQALPEGAQAAGHGAAQIAALPEAARAAVLDAYRGGLTAAFALGSAIAALEFVAVLFLPERPLR